MGLTYTHARFGCSFLVFRLRGMGGLWGGGGLVLYTFSLVNQSVQEQRINMRDYGEIDQVFYGAID